MKILKNLVVIFAILGFFGLEIYAENIAKEGQNYFRLENPLPNQNSTLIKIFSYDCPFCYKYDKSVMSSVMSKLDGVEFKPYNLTRKAKFGEIASEIFATMIVLDKKDGVSLIDDNSKFKQVKFAYYKAYHDKKERWNSENGSDEFLKLGLDSVEMSQKEYEKAKKDPKVSEILNAWNSEQIYEIAKLQGIPAFIVNGKYLLNTSSIRSVDYMIKLIKELNELD
ncbi:MAG: thiol:disulfide interchange protein DsbA/DsbL [Campylobacter sp.]|nr:thiol:disulfide interchange protein DsbA/DsbL [Campylobacter sp.]